MRASGMLRACALVALGPACTAISQPDENLLYAALQTTSSTGPGTATVASSTGTGGGTSTVTGVGAGGTGGAGGDGGGGAGGTGGNGGGGQGGGGAGGGGAGGEGAGGGGAGGIDPACAGLVEQPPPPSVVTFLPGVTVVTVAGGSSPGFADGDGSAARFDNPVSLAWTGPEQEALYVTDFYNDAVRHLTVDGEVTTIFAGDLHVQRPFGLAVGPPGVLFVQTDTNPRGFLSSTTGSIWALDLDGLFDPQLVIEEIGRPRGMLLVGGELLLSDIELDVIRWLDVSSGTLSPLAGSVQCIHFVDGPGSEARFEMPYGVARDPGGAIVLADRRNHAIRRIDERGEVTTIAGDGSPGMVDGALADARFREPIDVAIDALGRIYVSDLGNQRVRRIDELADEVVTLAGDGTRGFANGNGDVARFFGQEGIEVTADGASVYLTDGTEGFVGEPHHRVRRIDLP